MKQLQKEGALATGTLLAALMMAADAYEAAKGIKPLVGNVKHRQWGKARRNVNRMLANAGMAAVPWMNMSTLRSVPLVGRALAHAPTAGGRIKTLPYMAGAAAGYGLMGDYERSGHHITDEQLQRTSLLPDLKHLRRMKIGRLMEKQPGFSWDKLQEAYKPYGGWKDARQAMQEQKSIGKLSPGQLNAVYKAIGAAGNEA